MEHFLKKLSDNKLSSSATIFCCLIVIVLLACLLRFWQLGQVPAGFHSDEAAYGYNAYSLLLTGKDEYGKTFPLTLKSFGEYKPALYAYLTIPWVEFFGLTPLAVRITSAIFGVFTVALFYFLVKKISHKEIIGLISAFLLAVSPWHIILSRTTSEVVVSIFFILLLVYALLNLKERFSIFWLLVALLGGVLAMESYTASRFFVLIIAGLALLFSFKRIGGSIRFNFKLLLLCICFLGIGLWLTHLDGSSRFSQVSIFSNPETKLVLEEQIREDEFMSPFITRFFHNKIEGYGRTFLQNYGSYFTFDFLFLHGGYPYRVQIPDSGLFYIWQLPFLLVGLYFLFKKRTKLSLFFVAGWFLLLVPAALTFDEVPNIYRSVIVLPIVLFIIAVGMYEFGRLLRSYRGWFLILVLVIGLASLYEFIHFKHEYVVHQEVHQPWYRGYAYKHLAEALKELGPNYGQIILTKSHGSPYIYLLFYSRYDPGLYQSEGSLGDFDYRGFGKYAFSETDCPLNVDSKDNVADNTGVLYVVKGDCEVQSKDLRLVKTIYWQDHNPAFKLLEYKPPKNKSESHPSSETTK